jgi:hypothetical protein
MSAWLDLQIRKILSCAPQAEKWQWHFNIDFGRDNFILVDILQNKMRYTRGKYKRKLWISPILVWNFYPNEYAACSKHPWRSNIRKKAVGRPRLQYLKQVARNTAADSYTAMKIMACNKSRWKAANLSNDWRIRRGRLCFGGGGGKGMC